MSNFLFLKNTDENLFNIIADAERLFRDEYFEQSIIQTRRFAENICKELLKDNMLVEETFDSMINRIKDQSFGNLRMQEFSEDLFYIKKHGNNSAHSFVATKDGEIALECLERSYEIAVFYTNTKYGYNKKLDKSVFSEEMLMTGKSTAKPLKERYSSELKKARTTNSKSKATKTKPLKASKVSKKAEKAINRQPSKWQKRISITLSFLAIIAIIAASICKNLGLLG